MSSPSREGYGERLRKTRGVLEDVTNVKPLIARLHERRRRRRALRQMIRLLTEIDGRPPRLLGAPR